MTAQEAQLLVQRYLDGDCSAEESALVEDWWEQQQVEFPWELPMDQRTAVHDRMLSKIRAGLSDEVPVLNDGLLVLNDEVPVLTGEVPAPRIYWRRYAWRRYVAAAAVLALIVGVYFLVRQRSSGQNSEGAAVMAKADRLPGGNHAVLRLAGGRQILLDSAANGVLALQGNDHVVKQNGILDYRNGSAAGNGGGAAFVHTLETPRGGEYQLVLPDGTKVWLDAASSITYPTIFRGAARQVTVTGQAYFEVVHNAGMPFEVRVGGQVIRDIGTSFNINSYADEPETRITLASGAVAIEGTGQPAINGAVQPVILRRAGQQLQYHEGRRGLVGDADLSVVLSWKNGLFNLTSADIGTVMRQIARWYDVEILYAHGVPSGHITGKVPRNTNLSIVLKVLETSGIHFTVEGKKIHVTS